MYIYIFIKILSEIILQLKLYKQRQITYYEGTKYIASYIEFNFQDILDKNRYYDKVRTC